MKERSWLKYARMIRKLSKQQLADRIGISEEYYTEIENGKAQKNMDESLIQRLSTAFGVSMQYIAFQEGTEFSNEVDKKIISEDMRKDLIIYILSLDEVDKNAWIVFLGALNDGLSDNAAADKAKEYLLTQPGYEKSVQSWNRVINKKMEVA